MSHSHKPLGAGHSSFSLVDWPLALGRLKLQPGETVLDLGCGAGDYTLAIAGALRDSGRVLGLDLWPEGIAKLKERAAELELANLEALTADAGRPLPVADASVDLFFMATVFHDFVREGAGDNVAAEIVRVLKPGGRLAIIEFNKSDDSPGPPKAVKLSPEQLQQLLEPLGLKAEPAGAVGPHNYLMLFRR